MLFSICKYFICKLIFLSKSLYLVAILFFRIVFFLRISVTISWPFRSDKHYLNTHRSAMSKLPAMMLHAWRKDLFQYITPRPSSTTSLASSLTNMLMPRLPHMQRWSPMMPSTQRYRSLFHVVIQFLYIVIIIMRACKSLDSRV